MCRSSAPQINERLTGKDSLVTATSLLNLAMMHKANKHPKTALQLLTRVLKIQEMLLPEDHPDTARTMHNMATLQVPPPPRPPPPPAPARRPEG